MAQASSAVPGSALLHIALFLLTTRDCETKTCVQVHPVWKALRFRQPSHLIPSGSRSFDAHRLRGGCPLLRPVLGRCDRVGSTQPALTDLRLVYPRPSMGWLLRSSVIAAANGRNASSLFCSCGYSRAAILGRTSQQKQGFDAASPSHQKASETADVHLPAFRSCANARNPKNDVMPADAGIH